MELADLVVPVREGANNEPLRYALRSWAANLPHRHVWIVGFRPWWAAGARHIPTHQRGNSRYANTTSAMRAACEHPEVSDPFIWCNDDFFVMRPQPEQLPVYHRGPVRELEAQFGPRSTAYLAEMRRTRDFLVGLGHDDPVSYDLHVPLPVEKTGMLLALDTAPGHDAHKRTVFGVLNGIGGTAMADVKVQHRGPQFDAGSPFLSTMPDSFANGAVGRLIRAAFPEPCAYETGRRR
ncbi:MULTISPECIES: hypothetical protein [Streptomyces]|uniref:Uncharacterized protein n=1 Tax=Streptomyces canarius TaxID=285453 RepID=A0ABQ3CG66_9ACTN|nr:hypothetical protein [Streptomyces canarius]GHA09154.1 hypothetical protein GCM10010345_11980 [Streptomyces canarius]